MASTEKPYFSSYTTLIGGKTPLLMFSLNARKMLRLRLLSGAIVSLSSSELFMSSVVLPFSGKMFASLYFDMPQYFIAATKLSTTDAYQRCDTIHNVVMI